MQTDVKMVSLQDHQLPRQCSVKNPLAIARDVSSIPGSESGRSEEDTATPSSILAWEIP